MRKYIDMLFKYFGYVPAHTKLKVVHIPQIEYVERIIRDSDYKKFILRSEVVFSEEMADAMGAKFKTVVEDELSKRMVDQIKKCITISQVPSGPPFPEKRYRAALMILKK